MARIKITTEHEEIVAEVDFEKAPRNGNDMVNGVVEHAREREAKRLIAKLLLGAWFGEKP